jgi:hypothetical protein
VGGRHCGENVEAVLDLGKRAVIAHAFVQAGTVADVGEEYGKLDSLTWQGGQSFKLYSRLRCCRGLF